MRIDPVVALIDEIERAYRLLALARESSNWTAMRGELARIAALHEGLRKTEPATAIGAAHLLREAAGFLPVTQRAAEIAQLEAIAVRLDEGIRMIADLIVLRGLARDLARPDYGRQGLRAAELVALALRGAARPVVIYRAAGLMARSRRVSAAV